MTPEVTYFDVIMSMGIGLALGWFVGGLWNLMLGRRWNGKSKG